MVFIYKVEDFRLLLLTFAVGLWLYWLWTRRSWYKFSLQFPGDFGLPLIGSFLKIKHVNNVLPAVGKLFENCGKHTICVWVGLYPVLATVDPEIIEKVLTSREFLSKAMPSYEALHTVYRGGSLITSSVEKWLHDRKMINPCFSHNVLVGLFPVFNKAKNLSLGKLKLLVDGKEHRLSQMFTKISTGITLETTMGRILKAEDQLDGSIVETFIFLMDKVAMKGLLSFLKLDGLFCLYTKYNQARKYLYTFVEELVDHRLHKLSSSNEHSNNPLKSEDSLEDWEHVQPVVSLKKTPTIFIDQAIQLYRSGQFSLRDIICESNGTVAAGSETTGNCVFSTLVLLAMHPEYQERLFEEVVSLFPEKTFDVEYDQLQQLPYMDMVINETLRLTPPAPFIGRHVMRDTQLREDLIVPKDVQIIISIFHLHRRTDIWGANAERYDPDHFLPENLEGQHSYAFIPFSKGLRNCIGWRYALNAIKVLLCGIIRNYRFTTNFTYEEMQFAQNVVLKYVKEPLLEIHERQ